MKKTLLVTIDFPPAVGGVATYWARICSSVRKGALIALTNQPNAADANCEVVQKKLLYKRIWPKWLLGIFQVYRTYKKHNCEQILVAQVLPVGNMVYFLHKLFNIPYVVQIYGMDLLQAKKSKRKNAFVQKILLCADHVFVNSLAVGELLREYGLEKNSYTVIYPIPKELPAVSQKKIDHLKAKYELTDKKIVLTVGRFVKRKGFDITLGAMTHVWQNHEDAVYVMVGDGPDKERVSEMARANADKVILTGTVSEEEKNTWFAACDVFVMPARQTVTDIEGFGIVYLEAHQYEKPVIAGCVGGCPEAVDHEKTGLVVDPESVDEVAEAIVNLLDNPKLAKEYGQNGKARLNQDLSWEESMAMFEMHL